MHIAQALLFVLMACTLQNFDITPAKDEAGNEIEIRAEGVPGVIKYVDRFFERESSAERCA